MADHGADTAQQQPISNNTSNGDVTTALSQEENMQLDHGGVEDQVAPPPQERPLLRSAVNKTLLHGIRLNLGRPSAGGGWKRN